MYSVALTGPAGKKAWHYVTNIRIEFVFWSLPIHGAFFARPTSSSARHLQWNNWIRLIYCENSRHRAGSISLWIHCSFPGWSRSPSWIKGSRVSLETLFALVFLLIVVQLQSKRCRKTSRGYLTSKTRAWFSARNRRHHWIWRERIFDQDHGKFIGILIPPIPFNHVICCNLYRTNHLYYINCYDDAVLFLACRMAFSLTRSSNLTCVPPNMSSAL